MKYKKIEGENGWIVFIVDGCQVIEVHSTGYVTSGSDDRAFISQHFNGSNSDDLLKALSHDAKKNDLHSQNCNRNGVRWSE